MALAMTGAMPRFVVIALLLVAGCTGTKLGGACARHSDCNTGYCTPMGTCGIAPVDAATGSADASNKIPALDGGTDDANDVDASTDDADAL